MLSMHNAYRERKSSQDSEVSNLIPAVRNSLPGSDNAYDFSPIPGMGTQYQEGYLPQDQFVKMLVDSMGAVGPNWLENFTTGLANGTVGPCPSALAPKSPLMESNWDGLGPLPKAINNMKEALLQQQVTLVKKIKSQLKDLSQAHKVGSTKEATNRVSKHLNAKEKPKNRKMKYSRIQDFPRNASEIQSTQSGSDRASLPVHGKISMDGMTANHRPHNALSRKNRKPSGVHRIERRRATKPVIDAFDNLVDVIRSPLGSQLTTKECAGFFRQMSTETHCSRALQTMIKTGSQKDIKVIYDEVSPFTGDVAFHPSGNYVVQNLIIYGDARIKKGFFDILRGNLMCLSEDVYGCRVAQVAIQHLRQADSLCLATELKGSLVECVKGRNANHVLQACVVSLPSDKIAFMMDFFADKIKFMAVHPYGCRVLQRVMEFCDDPERKIQIINSVIPDAESLALNQYGNYIIQYALVYGTDADRDAIVQKLAPKIHNLSCHKYASNVIERCLAKGSSENKNLLISKALEGPPGSEGVRGMSRDKFGNYVIQKLVETASPSQRKEIEKSLDDREELREIPFGKAVAGLFDRLETKCTCC